MTQENANTKRYTDMHTYVKKKHIKYKTRTKPQGSESDLWLKHAIVFV